MIILFYENVLNKISCSLIIRRRNLLEDDDSHPLALFLRSLLPTFNLEVSYEMHAHNRCHGYKPAPGSHCASILLLYLSIS